MNAEGAKSGLFFEYVASVRLNSLAKNLAQHAYCSENGAAPFSERSQEKACGAVTCRVQDDLRAMILHG